MPDYTPTFADVCSAIADGGLIATLEGSTYAVNALELRRYFNRSRTFPAISSADSPLPVQNTDLGIYPSSPSVQKH